MLDLHGFLAMVSDGSSVGGITAVEKLVHSISSDLISIISVLGQSRTEAARPEAPSRAMV